MLGRPIAAGLGAALRVSSRRAGVALVYHVVGDPAGDPRRELLPALGTALFDEHLRHLASRYQLVDASRLPHAVRERRRGERFPVAITFDDDLRSHLDVVAPRLVSRRIPATFYVAGNVTDGRPGFWWERLQRAVDAGADLSPLALASVGERATIHDVGREIERLPPDDRERVDTQLAGIVGMGDPGRWLAPEDISRLASSGFEIGFHTRSHDALPELDDESLNRAFVAGRAELEEMLGHKLVTIAYPHGRADERIASAARAAGFTTGFTGEAGPVTPASNPLLLGRVSPSYDSVGELALTVSWALVRAGARR